MTVLQNQFENNIFEIKQADSSAHRVEVVFVDSRVSDAKNLLAGLSPDCTAVFIDAGKDGLSQMADYLSAHPGADAVHILAHGSDGNLLLGSTFLDSDSIKGKADDLSKIGGLLSEEGDILIYSCGFGAGDKGAALVGTLAAMTGADVAASDDRTGKGGDWDLEIRSGKIDADLPFSSQAVLNYDHDLVRLPVIITVTNNNDSGAGSLRQAISDSMDGDTITFASGMTINLSTKALDNSGVNDDSMLVINKGLTIDGDLDNDGTPDVVLDADYNGRVLKIESGTVTLDGLTLTNGLLSGDGGNYDSPGGSALGAAIYNDSTLTILNSNITGNTATGGGGGGGAYHGGAAAYEGFLGFGGGGGSGISGHGGAAGGNSLNSNGAAGANGNGGGGAGGAAPGISSDRSYTPANGSAGGTVSWTYQGNNYSGTIGGDGGTSSGGGYGGYAFILDSGGYGGSVTGAGGGGGGAGTATGAIGGSAVGGIYNKGTLNIASTNFILNQGAGGGGGGGRGAGGTGTGAVYNEGTLNYNNTSTTFNINNLGAGGFQGNNSVQAASVNDIAGTAAIVSDWDKGPYVTSVNSSTANGRYNAGDVISIQVVFSENVDVAGTPTLTLETGTTDRVVDYFEGSGTNTLTFKYTVQTGDASLDLDYANINALDLNGGTITSATKANANCNLPSPGMANSLGANKAIAIGPAASITAPGTFSVTEDVSAAIAGISFADADAGDSIETATLSVNSGTLTATTGNNVTVGGTAQALTLTGKIADINAFVAAHSVTFTTAQDATSDVSLGLGLINNGGSQIVSKTATITVAAVNDAPVNNVPATQTVMAGSSLAFSSANNNLISVTDVDAGDSQNMTVEVRSTGGTLSWAIPGTSNFWGAQAKLSTLNQFYLSSLSFTPDSGFTGQASIKITTTDLGNTGTGGALTDIDFIYINVDGTAPTLAASGSTPADNATVVSLTASPQIKFSENIKFGTSGSIVLYNVTTNAAVETFDIATAQGAGNGKVSISGNTLTVNPTADLALNTEYAIKISGDAIKDIPGNSFAGISDNITYNFKTDFAPVITSNGGGATAAVNVAENTTTVTTVTSTDSDPGQITLYSITGGADASKFSLNAGTGVLTFRSAPDFEAPQDTNSDNIYVVEVTADDANGGRDLQAISVTVTDVNETVTPPPQPPAPPQPPQPPQPNVIPPVNQWGNYPDNDHDGIPETVEKQVPGLTGGVTGDGNGDGIQDTAQKGVSSIPFDYTSGNGQSSQAFLTLVGGAEEGKIKDDAGQPVVLREVHHEDAPANLPSDVSMPFGMISFKADAPSAGSSVGFSIYVDGSVPVNGYWKQDKNGNWVNLASSAMGGQVITEGGKTRLDFLITDGGIFDKDGKADGVITDPGAPGWRDLATSFDENYYLESKLAELKADGYTQYTTTQQVKDGIIQAGLTVLQHFQLCSLKEGTNPNQFVNTAEYLQAKAVQLNQAGFGGRTDWSADDVKNGLLAAGFTNVVDHFKSSGWLENINPSNRFDISEYLKTNGEVRGLSVDQIIEGLKTDGLDPLEHYVKDGQNKPGITISAVSGAESVRTDYVNTSVFNENYYLQSKYLQLQAIGVTASIGEISAGIANSGMTLFEHFQKYSLAEGTDPNQFFDTSEYLQAKAGQMNAAAFGGKTNWTSANVKSSMLEAGYTTAMDHFKTYGWLEDVNPSSRFDVSTYLETWAAHSGTSVDNVKATFKQQGFDPVTHYLNYGQNESGITVKNAASRSFGADKSLIDDSNGVIYGGTGNDVFVSGSGLNAISDQGGIDTLRFDEGITKDSIALFKTSSGTDLIWDMGGANQIKVLNQTSAASAVEEFVTKDGYWLSSTDVNKVLQDMTTFASNNGIAMTNINDVRNSPDLMNVINTAWHAPA
ncbi:DUF4347 domain-containing protein [Desulforegula conservatrix]|uniref:DUF4347 domain-containing protein n=1 Tax=Desulforegula conservatrix TaxID=153026 RepID=UPI000406C5F2|nr:DUF4347 domain-containing protein [Desulforegula conservatrix]